MTSTDSNPVEDAVELVAVRAPSNDTSRGRWDLDLIILVPLLAMGFFFAVRFTLEAYHDDYRGYSVNFSASRIAGAAIGVTFLVVLFARFYLARQPSGLRVVLVYVTAVLFWVLAHGGVALSFAATPYSPHEWLSTAWYWSLHPLPIDIAGPIGWKPPIASVDGWAGAALVGLQAYSVLLVLAGAALLIKGWRESRSARNDQRATARSR